jgi:ribosome-associated translation inhibitor RaiA
MFVTCYTFIDYAEDEHILITSDQGLDSVLDSNLSEKEKKSLVRSRMNFGTWWFKPIRDEKGAIVGTNMFAVVQADAGGQVPKWIQNVAAPTVAVQSSHDVKKAIMEMKVSKSNELLKLKVDEAETNVAFEEISGAMRSYLEKNKKKVPSKTRH